MHIKKLHKTIKRSMTYVLAFYCKCIIILYVYQVFSLAQLSRYEYQIKCKREIVVEFHEIEHSVNMYSRERTVSKIKFERF